MYQLSQSCAGYCGRPSSLEYITNSSSNLYNNQSNLENTFYSISSNPINEDMFVPSIDYNKKETPIFQIYNKIKEYLLPETQVNYGFQPDNFLKAGKEGEFVGKAEEVKEFVEETFESIFNRPFPDDIKVSLLNKEEFKKISPSDGAIGLSINRSKYGLLSEIFILNDSLARVMLTIGHELGHVLTETLDNPHDEEAKAYAFSLEWMRIIKENNIANLEDAIIQERPARNGLHNIAFDFVTKMIRNGKEVWNVYLELINRDISIKFLQSQ
jgi:hypothetical protein